MYKVQYKSVKILKALNKLHPQERKRIIQKIEKKLKNYSPFIKGIKKLEYSKTLYRLRIGDYRVLFEKYNEEKIITVVLIEKRDSVYKDKS